MRRSRRAVPAFGPELPLEIFARTRVPADAIARRSPTVPAPEADDIAPRFRPRSRRKREPGLLQRGAVVDKYRIEELLGTGGFGAVYRATHMLLQTPVALKLLRPSVLAERPDVAEQLLYEARFAAKINHKNVVRILDVTRNSSISYVVMEYIDGEALSRAIERQGRLDQRTVLGLGLDVANGLAAGFREGLIHRDIKPANILVTRGGTATIVDFGLARMTARHGSRVVAGARQPVVGTRDYMSPEQERDPAGVDHRADIFGLGVTLYEALVGQLPFAPGSTATERVQPMSVPGATPALGRLVLDMLAFDRELRPQSYAELLRRLEDAAARAH